MNKQFGQWNSVCFVETVLSDSISNWIYIFKKKDAWGNII